MPHFFFLDCRAALIATGAIVLSSPLIASPQLDPVVFNNTVDSGSFHDVSAGLTVFDEGRIPSTTAPEGGAQDSYSITQIELGYATRSLGTQAGGPGARIRIEFYASGSAVLGPDELSSPVAVYDLTGLPASAALGSLSIHRVPVTLPTPVCFRADGDGKYDALESNGFVWSFAMPDESFGSAGPLISGDPLVCGMGDGTYYQGSGACATGLGAVDGFGQLDRVGRFRYLDFGGYPQNEFGSFYLLARAPLSGDCAGCGVADPFYEDNDTCASATPLPVRRTDGLIAEAGDDDYYVISVPSNADLRMTAIFDGSLGDLNLELYESSCGVLLAAATSVGNDEVLEYFDCGGVARDLVVRVIAPASGCVTYDLLVEATPVIDDAFEDNDVCGQSTLAGISTFTTRDLEVSECDADYYTLRVVDQREVRLDVFFEHLDSNVDVRIYDATCSTLLDQSLGQGDVETVTYFNNTGVDVAVIAEVVCQGGRGHATYALSACYSLGDLISFQTCVGANNSTGRPSTMCARGSDVAADNFVLFYAVDLPANVFGYFITSESTDLVPMVGGGPGTLCLGATGIGRYAYDVLLTNSSNAAFYQPDLTQTPLGNGFGPILSGDTRYWQFWYRDLTPAGTATSNFTSGVGVTFQ